MYPLRKFFQFAGLAGCGWLLDFGILLTLVRVADVPPSLANVVSSLIAASTVFLVSRAFVFAGPAGGVHVRLGLYVLYTLAVILAASVLVGLIATRLRAPGGLLIGFRVPDVTASAAAAKVLVTPPQLILNFFVSRFLSERSGLRTRSVARD